MPKTNKFGLILRKHFLHVSAVVNGTIQPYLEKYVVGPGNGVGWSTNIYSIFFAEKYDNLENHVALNKLVGSFPLSTTDKQSLLDWIDKNEEYVFLTNSLPVHLIVGKTREGEPPRNFPWHL